MEDLRCSCDDKGLAVVVFIPTCITVAFSIDEVCVLFVIGEEVREEAILLLRLRITSSSSTISCPLSSLSSVSFIEADNGEFDGEEEEEDNPLFERSRGCWGIPLEFLSPSLCLEFCPKCT